MPTLAEFIPNSGSLVEFTPEDLGIVLLNILHEHRTQNFTLSDLQLQARKLPRAGRGQDAQTIDRVLAEAWHWLMNEGLLIEAPDQPNGYFCLTRKAAALRSEADINTYRQGNLLPPGLLHPRITEKVRPMFLRGDYDVAVFQAFKEVEVAVRKAGKYDDELIGTKLMRKAFDPEVGPLRPEGLVLSEREAIAHLYAGAIGYCKNPQSHRDVQLRRTEAARLIVFASYLLEDVEITAYVKSHSAETR
jgi:uncharacterized protein (TIGR02391 family)